MKPTILPGHTALSLPCRQVIGDEICFKYTEVGVCGGVAVGGEGVGHCLSYAAWAKLQGCMPPCPPRAMSRRWPAQRCGFHGSAAACAPIPTARTHSHHMRFPRVPYTEAALHLYRLPPLQYMNLHELFHSRASMHRQVYTHK